MDPTNVVLAIAGVAALFLSIRAEVRHGRVFQWQQEQEKRRTEWEREQERTRQEWERRQLEAAQPHLVPVSAAWAGLNDTPPPRLSAEVKELDLELHNQGNSTPLDVAAVLFPARTKNPQSHTLTDNLYGTYWEGRLDVSPAADGRTRLMLYQRNYPINGTQSLIEGFTLFAPNEPILSLPPTDRFYCARLTLSYRDANGRMLGLIYDAESVVLKDVLTQVWRWVKGPVEVSKSLQELIDETRRDGDQAQKPS